MLVRQFISHRLRSYYAQPSQSVVGGVNEPLSLHLGRLFWLHTYKRYYQQNDGQWLTPVELFQPYYSRILVNWMRKVIASSSVRPLRIVELGPGRGTNARIILETLETQQPAHFEDVLYTLLDSSESLLELQKKTLSKFNADHLDFRQNDLMLVAQGTAEFLPPSAEPTVVLALEVWDNLPHDKLRIQNGVIEHAEIRRADNGEPIQDGELHDHSIKLEEVFTPLTDPLIQSILKIIPEFTLQPGIIWIPSVAYGLLQRLRQDYPRSSLLLADFDWLPPGDFDASHERTSCPARTGEPIITSMDDTDHPCYIEAPLLSDILFPTNFRHLSSFCRRLWDEEADVRVYKQRDFLSTFGPEEVNATTNWISGFSPMINDFDNCSIMTIVPKSL